ncbi:MAG: hypothetical protein ACREOM_05900 [Candidatus Dormibacteraceae bacterium]
MSEDWPPDELPPPPFLRPPPILGYVTPFEPPVDRYEPPIDSVGPRRGYLDKFGGLPWWQIVLAVLPLTLVVGGGLLGALVGAMGLYANLSIAHTRLGTVIKVPLMIGMAVACYLILIVAAGVVHNATQVAYKASFSACQIASAHATY